MPVPPAVPLTDTPMPAEVAPTTTLESLPETPASLASGTLAELTRPIAPTATPQPRRFAPRTADMMLYLAGGSFFGAIALAVIALQIWRRLN